MLNLARELFFYGHSLIEINSTKWGYLRGSLPSKKCIIYNDVEENKYDTYDDYNKFIKLASCQYIIEKT